MTGVQTEGKNSSVVDLGFNEGGVIEIAFATKFRHVFFDEAVIAQLTSWCQPRVSHRLHSSLHHNQHVHQPQRPGRRDDSSSQSIWRDSQSREQ